MSTEVTLFLSGPLINPDPLLWRFYETHFMAPFERIYLKNVLKS